MTEKNYHNDNKSFLIYKDWYKLFAMLDERDAGRVLMKLFDFAINGADAQLEGMPGMAYAIMRDAIERDGIKWEMRCKKNSENASKRWEEDAE